MQKELLSDKMMPSGNKMDKGVTCMQSFKHASENIKLLLSYKNWSQEILSKKTGISISTLKRKLKNNNGWTLSEAIAISNAFGLPMEDVFFDRMVPNGTKTA